jgi:hypothetical protein
MPKLSMKICSWLGVHRNDYGKTEVKALRDSLYQKHMYITTRIFEGPKHLPRRQENIRIFKSVQEIPMDS